MVIFGVFVTLLSPSHKYALLCYVPTLVIAIGVEAFLIGDFKDEFYVTNLANTPLVPIVGALMYYILQLRELKRFME